MGRILWAGADNPPIPATGRGYNWRSKRNIVRFICCGRWNEVWPEIWMSCAFTHGDDYGVRLVTDTAAVNVESSVVTRVIGLVHGTRWWNLPWLLRLRYRGPNDSHQAGNSPSSSRPPGVISCFWTSEIWGSSERWIDNQLWDDRRKCHSRGCGVHKSTYQWNCGRNDLRLTSGKDEIIRVKASSFSNKVDCKERRSSTFCTFIVFSPVEYTPFTSPAKRLRNQALIGSKRTLSRLVIVTCNCNQSVSLH